MADVASRDLSSANVIRGRISSISVSDGTDKKLTIDNLSMDAVVETWNEEVKITETELEDLSTLKQEAGRDFEIVLSISEINTTDIATINGSTITHLIIETAEGGANSTGVTVQVASADLIHAYTSDLRTKIRCTKRTTGTTLAYTVTDNAA